MSVLKVGLIGCGGMGASLARQCRLLETAKITAVCDQSEQLTAELAGEFEAKAFSDHKELLESDVDAVIIATPNDLHAPMTIEAASKGKHVFCEKPMALSVADCDEMIKAADKAGVKLMVGQVLRLLGIYWQSHQIISSGKLGDPFAIAITRIGRPSTFKEGWRVSKEQAGGVLFEINVHELDYMRYIMGEAKTVYAINGHFTHSSVEYEDLAYIQIGYENGGVGSLHCGLSVSIPQRSLLIQCKKGTLCAGSPGGPISYSKFDEDVMTIEPSQIEKENHYLQEIRSWVDAVLCGTPMIFDGYDGRAAIELAEAAYKSAATGEIVRLNN